MSRRRLLPGSPRILAAAALAAAAAFYLLVYVSFLDRPGPHTDEGLAGWAHLLRLRDGTGLWTPALWQENAYRGGASSLLLTPFLAGLGWSLLAVRAMKVLALGAALCAFAATAWKRFGPAVAALAALLLVADPNLWVTGRTDFSNFPFLLGLLPATVHALWRWGEDRERARAWGLAGAFLAGTALWCHLLAALPLAAWIAALAAVDPAWRSGAWRRRHDLPWMALTLFAPMTPWLRRVLDQEGTLRELLSQTLSPEHSTGAVLSERWTLLYGLFDGSASVRYMTGAAVTGFRPLGFAAFLGATAWCASGRAGRAARPLGLAAAALGLMFLVFPPLSNPHHALLVLFPWTALTVAAAAASLRARGIAAAAALILALGASTLRARQHALADRVRPIFSRRLFIEQAAALRAEGQLWLAQPHILRHFGVFLGPMRAAQARVIPQGLEDFRRLGLEVDDVVVTAPEPLTDATTRRDEFLEWKALPQRDAARLPTRVIHETDVLLFDAFRVTGAPKRRAAESPPRRE